MSISGAGVCEEVSDKPIPYHQSEANSTGRIEDHLRDASSLTSLLKLFVPFAHVLCRHL